MEAIKKLETLPEDLRLERAAGGSSDRRLRRKFGQVANSAIWHSLLAARSLDRERRIRSFPGDICRGTIG